jgi:hypothetical protein
MIEFPGGHAGMARQRRQGRVPSKTESEPFPFFLGVASADHRVGHMRRIGPTDYRNNVQLLLFTF